ncbi:MAG: AbrB/MazE/SpoVT family DNA-binding domain-containing protein [Gemmatimonadaceae bacterium]
MKRVELKVTRIGNSRGVRLPAEILRRFGIGDSVIMEETLEGILLRPHGPAVSKLSWAETAVQIATARENWDEWDTAIGDGLEEIPWDEEAPRRVAEKKARYPKKPAK